MSLFKYFKVLFEKYIIQIPYKKNLFDHHFFDLKYYVHKSSSKESFARLLNISAEEVDQISISHYGVDFTTLIDEFRCQLLIKELENPINYTLPFESVVKLCGFNNIESFCHFIKQKTNSLSSNPNPWLA
jgi:hypothetical protein